MATTITPLASFDEALEFGSGGSVFRDFTPDAGARLMARATRAVENRCTRRMAPFAGLTESQRAQDVDQDILGAADMPLDLTGALGYSQAIAFSSVSMVRDVYLDQYAPVDQDLWTYNVEQILLIRAYGDTQLVENTSIEGPETDTGHFRFHLGIFCPVGTTIRVTYGGGYTVGIPEDLATACILQAMKLAVIGVEPETRKDMSTAELDAEILTLIAPWIRT